MTSVRGAGSQVSRSPSSAGKNHESWIVMAYSTLVLGGILIQPLINPAGFCPAAFCLCSQLACLVLVWFFGKSRYSLVCLSDRKFGFRFSVN
eukprot:s799_g17.t1